MLILQILLNNLDLGLQLAVDPVTGVMAFSAMASLLGGLFSNSQQQDINKQNIAFQQQENALNRMFAREQMATQQQYNQLNAAQAYRRQREFYDYMYNKNTLSAMVNQAEEAGVNPFALFDSQGFQGTSVPSIQQASAATPINAMGVAPHAEMIPSSFDKSVAAFSSIASALASLSQSGKNSAETESIKTKLHHEVNKLIAESDLLHDQDVKQDLQNSLDAYFAFSEREKGLSKLDNEIAVLNKSLLIKDEELTASKFENSLNNIKRELKLNEKKMSDKRYEELSITVDNLEENFRTMFALRRAQVMQAKAGAAESYAKAETENAIRPFNVGQAAQAFERGEVETVKATINTVSDAISAVNLIAMSPDLRKKLQQEIANMETDKAVKEVKAMLDAYNALPKGVEVNAGWFGKFGLGLK